MAEVGMQPVGLEHGEDAVAAARAAGLQVQQGYMDRPSHTVEGGPFAAVFIHNFIEHFPDPNVALLAMRHNLRSDGVAIVEVPNLDMILAQRMFSEFIGDHLLYFTQETLTRTLAANGFDVETCEPIWHDYVLSALCRKRAPIDASGFVAAQRELTRALDEFVSRFGPKRVAIWGAGHQALAVIALTDLGSRVRYVVDSAPFKQGRFTPASHVPIVAPETLRSDPVDAVIVMAASYSDEVVRILREQFDRNLQVAVVRDAHLDVV
jgi:SAM-dependent methyltransferase